MQPPTVQFSDTHVEFSFFVHTCPFPTLLYIHFSHEATCMQTFVSGQPIQRHLIIRELCSLDTSKWLLGIPWVVSTSFCKHIFASFAESSQTVTKMTPMSALCLCKGVPFWFIENSQKIGNKKLGVQTDSNITTFICLLPDSLSYIRCFLEGRRHKPL